jgi:hypothetical protein
MDIPFRRKPSQKKLCNEYTHDFHYNAVTGKPPEYMSTGI